MLLLVTLIFAIAAGTASAQMDWMPQLLRDLPPELQEGIPEEMSYDEYRKLNRNVDFFTMGMSMIVPGYGLFSVDRPVAAGLLAGSRAAGYGLIATGLIRQGQDLEDLFNWDNLNALQYERARDNALLLLGGTGINLLGWGLDVLWTFHVAERDKDFVIYKYGLQQSFPEEQEDRSLRYIEALREQPEKRVSRDYARALGMHLERFPYGETQARVDYLSAEYRIRAGDQVAAALHLARALTLRPSRRVSPRAQEILSALLYDNEQRWEQGWRSTLSAVARLAGGGVRGAAGTAPEAAAARRHVALIRLLAEAPDRSFREAALLEIRRLLRADTPSVRNPEVLITLGRLYESLDRPTKAQQVYTVIEEFYPESPEVQQAREALGSLELTTPQPDS